jgi:ABC-2 type transport system ATP-binding protein
MLEVHSLTKSYGRRRAVDDLSFAVHPGTVTGFLGPNGAGKTTTMRVAVGLTRPDSGQVLLGGQRYADLRAPLREVGALLDARAVHPRRTAREHLAVLAATHGIPRARVEEVLGLVGLADVAGRRPGSFSLGMAQRLGIATALLGDPGILLLDEPVNGLDPEGVRWVRQLLRGLAAEGRTVFLSSHLMSEMALTADRVVVLGRGRLVADVPLEDLMTGRRPAVRVRTPQPERLRALLPDAGVATDPGDARVLVVPDLTSEQVADLAARHAIPLHELTPVRTSLEDAYLDLTRNDVEYAVTAVPTVPTVPEGSAAR